MEKKKAYEKLDIPNEIILENIRFTFKTKIKNKDNFIYRCANRKCKVQVTLDEDNLLKVLAKNKDSIINYEVGKNPHSCDIYQFTKKLVKKIVKF